MNKIQCTGFLLTYVILFINLGNSLSQFNKSWNNKYENNKCPKLYPKKYLNYAPFGNFTSGNFTEKTNLKSLRQCVMSCCISDVCNVVFIFDSRCIHVECVSDELCVPLLRTGSRKWESHMSMILVKPVLPSENWSDILEQAKFKDINSNNYSPEEDTLYPYSNHQNELSEVSDDDSSNFLSHFINNLPIEDDDGRSFDRYRDGNSDIVMEAANYLEKVSCEVGASDDCPINSECVPVVLKLRGGICKCVPGTEENEQGTCVQSMTYSKGPRLLLDAMKKNNGDLVSDTDSKWESSSPKSVQNLTVRVVSKEVQLPDNEVTLAAYTIPDEKSTMSHYNYVWTLVDKPIGGFTGNMKQNGATVTLTELTEGQYRFKVTVNSTSSYGENFANVTVLPPQRHNKPPQVVITPQMQTVKLPNSMVVLDGSASKDDDHIISYHWELISGPIDYQTPLEDKPTLVLQDLKQPGNYTFKLTVEDSDHVKNSTTANVTVLNHTDYPPEANAGQDVIIYLPTNKLTLNGNMSSDDHEIVSWEWTKAAEDANKAVDMQNTLSPYLELSNLSEGVYTFTLKVTDSSGQSSSADVHVFVKPPTNTPPVANAGNDIFISLPQTWVQLNGTSSHDDNKIVAYTWRHVSGPTNLTIIKYNESLANATGLTKGQYVFSLTVLDDNGNLASDNVTVTVTQNKNSPPKAVAGGDQVLSLPLSVLILNGSKSSDDFRIVSWKWTRSGSGLAAGTVILQSDRTPVLMLTNIQAGRYVFELTVTDDQGESDHDTVSIQVKPDPLENNLLEMTLNTPVSVLTQSQLESLVQKVTFVLKDDIKMNVTDVRSVGDSGNTQILFFLSENKNKPIDGLAALALSRSACISAGAASVRTHRCLSSCSGRGSCDQAARSCRCDAFWMQSLSPWPRDQPDCDWSVVYASLGGVAILCACGALCYFLTKTVEKACAPKRQRARTNYRLLPLAEQDEKPIQSKQLSDSETDSDVLFETQKSKTTSFNRMMNGETAPINGWKKNGHFKTSRRVKT